MMPLPLILIAIASALFAGSLMAQEHLPDLPSASDDGDTGARWWIGAMVGVTDLAFTGELHELSPLQRDLASPGGFVHGGGNHLLAGAFMEYDAGPALGGMLALCYDNRSVSLWNGHPRDTPDSAYSRSVTTYLRYLSIEANIRLNLWRGLTLLAGPGVGLNIRNRLIYNYTPPAHQIGNGQYPNRQDYGWLAQARNTIIEGQATLRWDFPLDGASPRSAHVIAAPFLTYKITGNLLDPPEGSPNSYAATTVRAGLELRLAVGR